jgi:type II secretory ATPase GspE/PulE/Tfp pilus assembly ATPase PilB-like protein
MAGAKTYRGKGCARCNGSGYKGRIGLYEVLTLDKAMKQAIIDRETAAQLRLLAVRSGMRTLRMDAVEKVKNGVTTLEEVVRVTADDDEEVKVAAMNYRLESQVRAVSS